MTIKYRDMNMVFLTMKGTRFIWYTVCKFVFFQLDEFLKQQEEQQREAKEEMEREEKEVSYFFYSVYYAFILGTLFVVSHHSYRFVMY